MVEPNFIRVTPVLYAADVGALARFFDWTLGFNVAFLTDTYAYVHRETAALRVFKGAPEGTGRMAAYIDVEDVDGLWAEMKDALEALPEGSVIGPLDQPYGQREFHVRLPEGGTIGFGQTL
ncbi:MAG: hypothetical protein QM698_00825 [Micropepsaceae bacterium]